MYFILHIQFFRNSASWKLKGFFLFFLIGRLHLVAPPGSPSWVLPFTQILVRVEAVLPEDAVRN